MEAGAKTVRVKSVVQDLVVSKQSAKDCVVALAGNPNVGKSTVFNALTGMKQHTGNWPGKTVTNAQGYCRGKRRGYVMVDLPGTYSLLAHSAEEEAARDFICFGKPDAVVVVCDATCLERNLNLVLQIMEITPRVLVCVNLLDEAKRKGVEVDLRLLSQRLRVPVVGTIAQRRETAATLVNALDRLMAEPASAARTIKYPEPIERAVDPLAASLGRFGIEPSRARWLSLRLLDRDIGVENAISARYPQILTNEREVIRAVSQAREVLRSEGITPNAYQDMIVSAVIREAEAICEGAVTRAPNGGRYARDQRIDRILTGKAAGVPIMILLFLLVFWLTITGANIPSAVLAKGLFWVQDRLSALLFAMGTPVWLHDALVLGVYRVLAWVVSVMLPPMAIFFPLFSFLEDIGYLPRIAYNLDKPFQRCSACGKQALCMCMGFGCNAVGVSGCRIIDSPRERLIAILTNSFVPCNGRFPTLIALITMFFVASAKGVAASLLSAAALTMLIVLGVAMTFGVSRLLSKTLLRGMPSSFTLELPSYRKPQLGKILVRSVLDRTLFVLGRAVSVAVPAGLVIWLMANVQVSGVSLLGHCVAFLDPFARLMGLDGVILMAFILGFPANEIVLPIILMTYLAQGSLMELGSLAEMKRLFVDHGWTWITAACTLLFSLFHWPCSTTLLTIRKETGSVKWTLVAFFLPTAIGVLCCMAFANVLRLF